MLRELKVLILTKFDTQGDFAAVACIDETRLSRIIRQRIVPRDKERQTFRRILGKGIDRIFRGEKLVKTIRCKNGNGDEKSFL
jgi:hypothetical protein